MGTNTHSAAASALGYLYQFDWALLEALEAYPGNAQRRISIELVDDLGHHDGTDAAVATALEQLKHHAPTSSSLTDSKTDVWKTMSAWIDAGPPGDTDGPMLVLVTTQTVAKDSALSRLRQVEHESAASRLQRLADAKGKLEEVARTSKDKRTAKSREAFLALTDRDRTGLLSRISVLDGSTPITGMDERLKEALGHVAPTQADVFLERLRGWWNRVTLKLLTGQQLTIRVLDVHTFVSQLRDEFGIDNLPTTVSEDDVRKHIQGSVDRRFVKQLEWVHHTPRYIELAILDYHRAYEQRARWATEDLIGLDELDRFEERLREDWRRRFEEAIAELDPTATPEQKATAGRALLTVVMNDASILVREHYRDRFFAVGTRHALADLEDVELAIGWHPEFRTHLSVLLGRDVA